jgi:hypothetical protein
VVVASLAVAVLAGEWFVRDAERREAAGQPLRQRYEEAYQARSFRSDGLGIAGFLSPGFSGLVTDEFGRPVPWVHNSLGFRSRREYPPKPAPGVLRVLMVGDSFVAGHRLAQDSTVGAQLESWLDREGGFPGAEVLIAAIEHPTTGLEYLQKFGMKLEPRVVLLGLTLGNDVAQLYFSLGERGQYRFGEAGLLEPNPAYDHDLALAAVRAQAMPKRALGQKPGAPPWNAQPPRGVEADSRFRLAALARRVLEDRRERRRAQPILSIWGEYEAPRLFDGNGLGLFLDPAPPEIERAYRQLFAVLRAYRRLCEGQGAEFVLAVHAQRFQIQPADWQATIEAYGLAPGAFDLAAPNRRLAEFCRSEGIACLDPTLAMAGRYGEERRTLYMPRGDMHWNSRGARTFFELTRESFAAAVRDSGRRLASASP